MDDYVYYLPEISAAELGENPVYELTPVLLRVMVEDVARQAVLEVRMAGEFVSGEV